MRTAMMMVRLERVINGINNENNMWQNGVWHSQRTLSGKIT